MLEHIVIDVSIQFNSTSTGQKIQTKSKKKEQKHITWYWVWNLHFLLNTNTQSNYAAGPCCLLQASIYLFMRLKPWSMQVFSVVLYMFYYLIQFIAYVFVKVIYEVKI